MSDGDTNRDGAAFGLPPLPGVGIEQVGPLDLPVPAFGLPDPEPATDGGTTETDAAAGVGVGPDGTPLDAAAESVESYNEYLDRAIEAEDCAFCESVLCDLKDRPLEEQVQGMQELKRLKSFINEGEMPDGAELRALLDEFEVVEMPGV